MLPFFTTEFGNPSSKLHSYGWHAEESVKQARQKIASFLSCEDSEIIFTSGASESINTALKGIFEVFNPKRNEIITVKTEHSAVLDVCKDLEKKGAVVHYLSVNPEGLIDLQELNHLINDKTVLISVMAVNNETGVIQDIQKIGEIARSRNVFFFSDLTQAAGKIPIDVNEMNVDIACLSAHKMYGPKGVGCLFKRRKSPRVNLIPLLHGGGHEEGLRSGTLNVPGIVGLGTACEIAKSEWWDESMRLSALRAKIEHKLLDYEGIRINGSTKDRVYNTSNICFSGRSANEMIRKFKNRIAVSFGSACSSHSQEHSHVLKAMGLNSSDIQSSIRFSLGRMTTEDEVATTLQIIEEVLKN
jgi:cysteine desulfurase